MKLNKQLFKSIVKECLVEILSEGLSSNGDVIERKSDLREGSQTFGSDTRRSVTALQQPSAPVQMSSTKRGHLDQITFGVPTRENPNPGSADKTKALVSKVTNDPIMREIFADTAASTLKEQHEVKGRNQVATKPADDAARIVAASDPSELFGGASEKWASLAFAPKINR
jgi:hypothetical protein